MLDDCYALYSAIAEKAKGIVLMDFIITKEIFHRPILSKFSNALKQLDLRIHSLSTNSSPHLEEICEMISEMPNLESLVLESARPSNKLEVAVPSDIVNIRSESLQVLDPGNFTLQTCICPSLTNLFWRDESNLIIEGNVEDHHKINDSDCYEFEAGKSGVKLSGIRVPKDCTIRIAADPNGSHIGSDY